MRCGRCRHRRPQSRPGIDPSARRISLSRLDERGALLGSEEAVDSETIDEVVRQSSSNRASTNLGNLFKKALGDG